MKVYFHLEKGVAIQICTFALVLTEQSSVREVLGEFRRLYQAKFSSSTPLPDVDNLILSHENGQIVGDSINSKLMYHVKEKEDLFVSISLNNLKNETIVNNANINTATKTTVNTDTIGKVTINTIHPAVKQIKELIQAKAYRKARYLCDDNLKSSKNNASLLILKAEILMNSLKYDEAADCAQHATSIQPNDVEYNMILAKCLRAAERLDESAQVLDKMLTFLKGSTKKNINTELDVVAMRSEILFDIGRHMDAANLINQYVHLDAADSHVNVLLAYASFALKYEKVEEATRALLKVAVLDQKNKVGRNLLSKLLSSDSGFNEMIKQLPPSDKAAPAYAFLAAIVKDNSAMNVCIKLLSLASTLKPENASYVLNLAHAYEILFDYKSAIQVINNFLQRNGNIRVGTCGFICQKLHELLPTDIRENSLERNYITPPYSGSNLCLKWEESEDTSKGRTRIFQITDNMVGEEVYETLPSGEPEKFSDVDLDILAIAFTTVKILYLLGRIADIPILFSIIEPTRLLSKTPPHETNIRNEHAYYQCIAQSLSNRIDALSACVKEDLNRKVLDCFSNVYMNSITQLAANNPLYIIGDSHVISPAWNIVKLNDENRLITPLLVTGIKHWHLRPESVFYPKANFESAVNKVPNGSDVVFLLGEIDCREGLLFAVEKDIYSNIQEGIEHTVKLFIGALRKIIQRKKFRTVYIHPILPVLNETRPIVIAYNAVYEKAIKGMKDKSVIWLNFFDQLLNEDKTMLLNDYKMDGTHINPIYVSSCLQNSL